MESAVVWVSGIAGEDEVMLLDVGLGEEAPSGSSAVSVCKVALVEGLRNKARARGGLAIDWEA